MGTGGAYLLWFGGCFAFVAFAGAVATVLYAWGRREERKREARRRAQSERPLDRPTGDG